MKKYLILQAVVFYCCLGLLAGCGPSHIQIIVESRINQELNCEQYQKFSFLSSGAAMPLAEKELQSFIKTAMENKGYIEDNQQAHFLIFTQAGTDSQKKREVAGSRPVLVYQPSISGGTLQTQYVIEGGGDYIVYTNWLKIDFIDRVVKKQGDKTVYLWQAKAWTQGESEFREVAKCLISALLDDFPAGQPNPKIIFKLETCR